MDISIALPLMFLGLVVGFIAGCIYSDVHWKPIVEEYKRAIVEYKKALKYMMED